MVSILSVFTATSICGPIQVEETHNLTRECSQYAIAKSLMFNVALLGARFMAKADSSTKTENLSISLSVLIA